MIKFLSFLFFLVISVSLTFAQLKQDTSYIFKSLSSDGTITCMLKLMIKADGKAYTHYEFLSPQHEDKAKIYIMGFSPTFSENPNGGFVLRVPKGHYIAIPISVEVSFESVGNMDIALSCACGGKGSACPVEVLVDALGGVAVSCGEGACTPEGCDMKMSAKTFLGGIGVGYVILPAEGVVDE